MVKRLFPEKSRRNIDLSAVEPAFQPIMADWLAYKSERGQTYRPLGLQRCYVRLLTLSGNDAAKARRIVDFSIANNYSGLFLHMTRTIRQIAIRQRTITPNRAKRMKTSDNELR